MVVVVTVVVVMAAAAGASEASEAASGRDSKAEGEQLIPPAPRRCQQEVNTQERNGPIEFQQSKWDN